MPTQQLTESEVATMRQILAQHDGEHQPMTIHDLNNPPKAPYRYQPFPKMIYDLKNSYPSHDQEQQRRNGMGVETVHIPAKIVTKNVNSQEELDEALAAGWSKEAPTFTEERDEPISGAYANEAARVDEKLEEQRQKRAYTRRVA